MIPRRRTLTSVDVAVVGGGLVGLAVAHRLLERHRGLRVVVLEKEDGVARHQSGRNSGVVHSGVYYVPGSVKARTCRAGAAELAAFCAEEGIALERCGKVIVAVEERELPVLDGLAARGHANGVRLERVDARGLRDLEPHAAGIAALWVPEAGIVDYRAVAERLAARIAGRGGEVRPRAAVVDVRVGPGRVRLETPAGPVEASWLVNCAGLWADRLARRCGVRPAVRIVPFRGVYYRLRPGAERFCRGLIYPVPDPRLPFLGIHLSRRIDGGVDVGPSAVLAFAREGYRLRDVAWRDLAEALGYAGFRRLARRHAAFGLAELGRAFSMRLYLRAARRLVPVLTRADLQPGPSGVRAQAVAPDGRLVDDFLFQDGERSLHVLSAASPAATACLRIGTVVAERLEVRWR